VLAVADGTLTIYREAIFDNLVLTQKDGRYWEYRHLKAESVPAAVKRAAACPSRSYCPSRATREARRFACT
jgi:hypothetical protein